MDRVALGRAPKGEVCPRVDGGGRTRVASGILLLLTVFFLLALPALALAWPTEAQYTPIYKGGVVLTDPTGDAIGSKDIVGDATYPAAYIFNDGTYIYFRLRLNADPSGTGGQGALKAFGWGVLFDTNQSDSDYEWLIICDGISSPEVVALRQNTVQGTIGDPSDSPEVDAQSVPLIGNYQVTLADSSFDGNADYFLEWRFDYALFKATTLLGDYDPIRVLFGSSNSAQTLTANGSDLAPGTTVTLPTGLSDYITPLGVTPSTGTVRFVTDLAGTGDETTAPEGADLYLRVDDSDENTDAAVIESVTVTLTTPVGDSETLVLTETGADTGVFTGTLSTIAAATPTAGNGSIEAVGGTTVTATYVDNIDASLGQGSLRTDTIRVIGVSLTIAKSASQATAIRGDHLTYTITLTNSGELGALVSTFADTPPAGFSYITGTTTGATTADPALIGGVLTWSGTWTVPGASGGTPGTLTLAFDLLVASTGGTFTNVADVSGTNFPALSTGPTAPVTVLAPAVTIAKSSDKATAAPGEEITYAIAFTNVGTASAHTLLVLDTLPPETDYVVGSLRAGGAGDTYDTATARTDGPGENDAYPVTGEVSGQTVIFNVPSLDADDGVPGTGADEGIVWFKVRVR